MSGRRIPGTCTVLYYHSIPTENRPRFARQMETLSRLTTPIRVDSHHHFNEGVRYAGITFDDGYENLIGSALPELESRRIPCVIFVIADAFGKVPIWIDMQPDPASRLRLMTVDEMKLLSPELVVIGAHTMTHPNLLLVDETKANWEIHESRARLEDILNREVKLFSFPYGAFNERLVHHCREAGYDRIFTTLPYPAFSEPQEFVTGRVSVEPTDWSLEFRLKLVGAYGWLPFAFSLKRSICRNTFIRRVFGAGPQQPFETLHRHVG